MAMEHGQLGEPRRNVSQPLKCGVIGGCSEFPGKRKLWTKRQIELTKSCL